MADPQSRAAIDPTTLPFESPHIRRRILASYWLIVAFALPLWWKFTSIDRLSLPESRVHSLLGKEWKFPVQVQLESHVALHPVDSVRKSVGQLLAQDIREDDGITIHLDAIDAVTSPRPGIYKVTLEPGFQAPVIKDRHLSIGMYEEDDEMSKDISRMRLASTLLKLLAPPPGLVSSFSHRVVKYAPRYRLAFTMLNQDAASGKTALSWEVNHSVNQYLGSTLDKLSVLHNFTVESQVQFHAPLAFKPHVAELDGELIFGLSQEDLTVFINSAEWTLSSSVSNDPVLHFVLFIPSAENSPLRILDYDGSPSNSNAFILPQWGGVVLMNQPNSHLSTADLQSVFTTFRNQLMALLGVPSVPTGIQSNQTDSFTDWQLDALIRQRALENVKDSKETLQSITALVNQIQNMPVGQDVKGDVQGALNALDQAYAAASSSSTLALRYSSEALKLASRAFFNPGMLALLYFPAEHKYAVYTPLFASVAAPLVAAVLREFMAWKRSRKSKDNQAVDQAIGKQKAE